jgi:hypothetical protein
VTLEAETGKRIVDKLVKVYLQDGRENWLLLHQLHHELNLDPSQVEGI